MDHGASEAADAQQQPKSRKAEKRERQAARAAGEQGGRQTQRGSRPVGKQKRRDGPDLDWPRDAGEVAADGSAAVVVRRGEESVPCPHDPTHTVKASGLTKHLRHCHVYQARLRLEAMPYYTHHLNSGAAGRGVDGGVERDGDQQRAAKVRAATTITAQGEAKPHAEQHEQRRRSSGRADVARFGTWVRTLTAALDEETKGSDMALVNSSSEQSFVMNSDRR